MSLKRGVFFTVLTQIPTLLLGILAGIYINRVLGPEGKGIHAILMADIVLFTMLVGLNFNFGLNYFISGKKIATERMVGMALWLLAGGVAVFALLLVAFHFFLPQDNFFIPQGPGAEYYSLFLMGSFTLTLINIMITGVFRGLRYFKAINSISVINGLLNAGLFAILFFNIEEKSDPTQLPNILLISFGILCLNTLFWIVAYFRKVNVKPQMRLKGQAWKKVLQFTLIGYLANIMGMLTYRLDFYILDHFKGSTQVGLYALAVNTGQLIWYVSNPIADVLQPFLNNPDEPIKERKFTFFSRLNFTMVLFGAAGLFLLADFLLPKLYGEEFAGAVTPLYWLLPGIVFAACSKVFAVACTTAGKVVYNLVASAVGLVLTVLLDLLLIPEYGMVGASIATSLSYFAVFIVVWLFLLIKLKKPFQNYFILQLEDIREFKRLIP